MRERLSALIAQGALDDHRTIVLSGDHGYALFDRLRAVAPSQFINVGVSEQAMVGYAAGLARTGFRPIVYGLAAFVPMRVLEQIKLDICQSCLPVLFLGDGAGLVYSTLGASHHCAEDIGCLRTLPHIGIYSPADHAELEICFRESREMAGPTYLRIGKSDRPPIPGDAPFSTEPRMVAGGSKETILVATGSMTSIAREIATEFGLSVISVPRLKPFSAGILPMVRSAGLVISIEEHSRYGGLGSALAECFARENSAGPRLEVLALEDKFAARCGSWQYALSEHNMSDQQLKQRVRALIGSA